MADEGPDILLGHCFDCNMLTRLFEFTSEHWICLSCYRDLVDAVLVTAYEEGEDAAS